MQSTEKSKRSAIDIGNSEAFEKGRLNIKLPYQDEYLEKLKLRYRELTLLNDILKDKAEELLKEGF